MGREQQERGPELRSLRLVDGDGPSQFQRNVLAGAGSVSIGVAWLRGKGNVEEQTTLRPLADPTNTNTDLAIGDVVECLVGGVGPPLRIDRLDNFVAAHDEFRTQRPSDV